MDLLAIARMAVVRLETTRQIIDFAEIRRWSEAIATVPMNGVNIASVRFRQTNANVGKKVAKKPPIGVRSSELAHLPTNPEPTVDRVCSIR